MHRTLILLLLLTALIVIHARTDRRSCPEEYRELRRRNDQSDSDSDEDGDQWREDMCERAMDLALRQRKPVAVLRNYCAHYDEALALAKENNDTTCEKKKREISIKRKRDEDDHSTDSDDDDDDKRRALGRREVQKRLALRFLRKRLS